MLMTAGRSITTCGGCAWNIWETGVCIPKIIAPAAANCTIWSNITWHYVAVRIVCIGCEPVAYRSYRLYRGLRKARLRYAH